MIEGCATASASSDAAGDAIVGPGPRANTVMTRLELEKLFDTNGSNRRMGRKRGSLDAADVYL